MAEIREEWRLKINTAWDISNQKRKFTAINLATVALDGHPATRTMVFRGFREGTDQLMLVTDARSSKIEQLAAHPWAEFSWYLDTTDEQFRLAGNVRICTADEEDPSLQAVRTAIWGTLNKNTQAMFFQPPPGRDRTDKLQKPQAETADGPPETLALILLDPVRVDYLDIGVQPNARTIYRVGPAGDWFKREVNP